MNIAFISTILDYPWGGADTLWTHAAEAACERGERLLISVSPIVAASPRIAALRAAGARIHLRKPAGPASWPARALNKLRRLAGSLATDSLVTALTEFQPDVIIISLGGTYDLILHRDWLDWFETADTKIRLIANWQQENPVLSKSDHALALRSLMIAESVNFVSTRNMEVTKRHLPHTLPHARVTQNPLRWRPSDISPWPSSSNIQLATVSRLDECKGIQLLLHALASISDRYPWHLNIYGQGPAENYFRQVCAHLDLRTRVSFHGHVGELQTIWAQNHLLVSPALEDGVPMTIPEAMLCQRPVLATAVGGAEDWLRNEESGFICPAPTLPLLIASLENAFAKQARWRELGQQAAESALARYKENDYLSLLA